MGRWNEVTQLLLGWNERGTVHLLCEAVKCIGEKHYSLLICTLKWHSFLFFAHLADIKISSAHKVNMTGYQTIAYLHIQQSQSNISISLESYFCQPDEFQANIHSSLVSTSWEKYFKLHIQLSSPHSTMAVALWSSSDCIKCTTSVSAYQETPVKDLAVPSLCWSTF